MSPDPFWIPPHSTCSHWFHTRRVESILHSFPLKFLSQLLLSSWSCRSPAATFCFLCCKESNQHVWLTLRGVSHSELSDFLWLWTGVEEAAPGERNQTWLNLRSHLFPPPPHTPSLIARVNITDFYFPLFTFYYRVVYISFPSSCRWSSLSLCIFCK